MNDADRSVHPDGWPVSYGSYVRGCRCGNCRAKQRAYYEQNRDEIAAKKRAYREQNRDEIAAKQRAEAERDRALVLLARGARPSEVMAELGCDYETVMRYLEDAS